MAKKTEKIGANSNLGASNDHSKADKNAYDHRANGGGGDDYIVASDGNDRVNAGGGDDYVTGGEGDDKLYGNGGMDTAVYSGSILDYKWEAGKGNSISISDLNVADGNDGTDTLKHFEKLSFKDYTFDLEGPNAAHVEATNQTASEDATLNFEVRAFDFDGGTPTIESLQITGTGSIELVETYQADANMGVGNSYSLRFTPGSDHQSLGEGESRTETVKMIVSDGQGNYSTKEFTIVIEGKNDAPVITDVTYNESTLKEDAADMASGRIHAQDIDANDTLTFAIEDNGAANHGTFTLDEATGEWSYAMDNGNAAVQALGVGESLTETLTVTVSDGNGGLVKTQISLEIQGQNDAPTISSVTYDDAILQEDGAAIATGRVHASDIDANDTLTFQVEDDGASHYGTLTLDEATGEWSYAMDNGNAAIQALGAGESLVDSFTVRVSDGKGGFVTTEIPLEIKGQNDAPVVTEASYDDTSLKEDGNAVTTGRIHAEDLDANDVLSFTVEDDGASHYGTLTLDEATGEWSYKMDNDNAEIQALNDGESLTETFKVSVSDGNGDMVSTVISFEINGTDEAPEVVVDESDGNAADGSDSGVETPDQTTDEGAGVVTDGPADGNESSSPGITATRDDIYHTAEGVKLEVGNKGVLLNESDLDESPALTISAINGDEAGVGQQVTLDSGAIVVLQADGSFTYDNNDAFAHLSSGEQAIDSFSYSVTDELGNVGTATAQFVIHGQDDFDNAFTVSSRQKAFYGFEGTTNVIGSDRPTNSLVGDYFSVGLGEDEDTGGASVYNHSGWVSAMVPDHGNDLLQGGDGGNYIFGDSAYIRFNDANGAEVTMGHDIAIGGDNRDYIYGEGSVLTFGEAAGTNENILHAGDDYLNGGAGNDIIVGDYKALSGSLSSGTNKVFAGDDIIEGGSGDDLLWGDGDFALTESGADVFIFAPRSGNDTIHDFEVGKDLIDLEAYGFTSLDDLSISYTDKGAIIDLDGADRHDDSITLLNVDQLGSDSFIFV